jgi:hypothetical protein
VAEGRPAPCRATGRIGLPPRRRTCRHVVLIRFESCRRVRPCRNSSSNVP